MNSGHYYCPGKNRRICADYALSGVSDDMAYAIVCAGSDWPDADFGTRALALSARETLRYVKATELSAVAFGSMAVLTASTVGILFPMLQPQALDSTLLVAWVRAGKLTALMYGDGVFIHRNHSSVRGIRAGMSTHAPDFLSYQLDAKRKEGYLSMGGNKEVYDCVMDGLNFSGSERLMKPLEPVVIQCPVSPGDVVAVCSAGMNSFRMPNNESIIWRNLVDDYTGFSDYTGDFVGRHLLSFQRRCERNLITHLDDISIAAIKV